MVKDLQDNLIKILILVAVVFVTSLAVSACSGNEFDTIGEELRDVEVESRDDDPAHIIHMPHGYSNVAFKCNGTTGLYVTKNNNGRALAAVPNDGNC